MQRPTDEQVASVPLFSLMSPEDRELVAAVAEVRTYRPGDLVFTQGDPANVILTILSGRVRVFTSEDLSSDFPEVLDAGDPLGDVGALEGGPYPASGMAVEPTECLVIPRVEFFQLLEQSPTFVRSLVHGFTHRIVELTRELRRRS
jgi:CRP/FNR family transcriptional regulator